MKRPMATNKEVKLDTKRYIVSKTDTKGIITYSNDYFSEISGYTQEELIGQPHSIVRHPDMPKVAFKLMWEVIEQNKNFIALVKNLTKDGSYYWVVTDFESKIDPITKQIIAYTAFRKAAPRKSIASIEPIYAKLLEIEKEEGMEASEDFLHAYLEQHNTTYNDFINKLVGNSGLFKVFFQTMKKLFS